MDKFDGHIWIRSPFFVGFWACLGWKAMEALIGALS